MKKYDIYNFDHGCNNPWTIETDSFKIIIDQVHCANLNKIERNASTQFTLDESFTPIVIEHEHKEGSFDVTAIIEVFNEKTNSYLYEDQQEYNYIDDIVLVLSFVTGKNVFLKEDFNRYSTKYHINAPLSLNHHTFKQIKEENIKKISELDLNIQFINTVASYFANDLFSVACYSSATLDVLSSSWAKQNGFSKYPNKKNISKLKKLVCEKVSQSIITDAKRLFLKLLKEEKNNTEIYKDINARLSNNSSPSALYKLKKFLVSLAIYPLADSKEDEEKLRWLNTVRNSVVHRGDLPKHKTMTREMLSDVVANITFLMLAIIQLYYSKEILKISDVQSRQTEQSLKSYFKTGKFRDKDIFNETYKEYMDRIKNDWSQRKII
jgi:hypothetical protein